MTIEWPQNLQDYLNRADEGFFFFFLAEERDENQR